jgi:hypothetical protein
MRQQKKWKPTIRQLEKSRRQRASIHYRFTLPDFSL